MKTLANTVAVSDAPATELLYLKMVNAYHFKGENVIDFQNRGLVSIVGQNFDAKTDPNIPGFIPSNGTGKSTIIRCLLKLWFGRKASKHEAANECMLDGKHGSGFLLESVSRRNNHEYMIRDVRKHPDYPTDGVQFFIDGKRVGRKNSEESFRATFLEQALGMTYEEFLGTCVITQNSSHVLINGSPQDRIEFISKMFGLSKYDELFDKFKTRYDNVTKELQSLIPLRAEYDTYTRQLEDLPKIADVKADVEEYEARLEKLRERRKSQRGKRDELRTRAEEVAENNRVIAKISKMRAASDLELSKPKTLRISLLENKASMEQKLAGYREAKRVVAKVADIRYDLKGALEDLPEEFAGAELGAVQEKLTKTVSRIDKLTSELTSEQNNKHVRDLGQGLALQVKQYKITREELANVDAAESGYAKYQKLEDAEQADIDLCIMLLDIKEGYDTSLAMCPTCGTKVRPEALKSEISQAKARMNAHEVTRREHHVKAQRYRLILDYVKFHEVNADIDLTITDDSMREKALRIKDLRERRSVLEDAVALLTVVDRCRAALEAAGASSHNSEDLDKRIAKIATALEATAADIEQVETYLRLKAQLREDAATDDVTEQLEALEARIEKTEDAMESVTQELERHRLTLNQIRGLRKRRSGIGEDLLRVSELEREERVLKALCQAYGKNGLKLEKIQAIIQAIKMRLPTWLSLTLTEPGFRVEVKDNNAALEFQVVQTNRIKNRKGTWSSEEKRYDVRTASGGEQTRIMIALIMTLIDIIPTSKRCNVLILDEPEKGLDTVNRGLVADIWIPLLRNKRETMMLITHSLDIRRRDIDDEIVITRKKNKATMKQGLT